MVERATDYPSIRADVLRLVAVIEAMLGRADDARRHIEESVAIFAELDNRQQRFTALGDASWVYRLLDDPEAAESAVREAFAIAAGLGDRTGRAWVACRLAQVLLERGEVAEAEPFIAEAETVPIVMNRTRVVGARARLLAARGDHAAEGLVAQLVGMLADAPYPNIKVDGFVDAAETVAALGDPVAAAGHARKALELAEAKGNVKRAAQIRAMLHRFEAPLAT
jgi:hypothetical protein